jgi:hypothetical protein
MLVSWVRVHERRLFERRLEYSMLVSLGRYFVKVVFMDFFLAGKMNGTWSFIGFIHLQLTLRL